MKFLILTDNPPTDGGAPVSQYEVEMAIAEKEKERRQAYVGRETECSVQDLLPGKNYIFLVRACNKVGVSEKRHYYCL